MPPTVTTWPSRRSWMRPQRRVDLARELVAERARADGSRRTARAPPSRAAAARRAATPRPAPAGGRGVDRAGAVAVPSPSRSKIEPWPTSASACVFWPAASACSSTSIMPRRVAPVESNAPQAIRLSSMPRFSTAMSTRSQKSQIDSNGRSLRAAMIARTAPSPTRLTAVRPKRMLAVDHREVGLARVDVRRQHLDAHVGALADVERHPVLGRHHRRDQRRHVLGRIVGAQVRGAVGDQRVAGGVGLVEGVVGARTSILAHSGCAIAAETPLAAQPVDELVLERRHQARDLLADRLAQIVRLGGREAGQRLGDLHELLLVDADPVRCSRGSDRRRSSS